MEILVEQKLLDLTSQMVNQELVDYVEEHRKDYEEKFRRYGFFDANETLEEYINKCQWEYFNNFHTNFPEGYVRRMTLPSRLDMPCRWLKLISSDDYSDLYLDHTPRQFFKIIDEVLEVYKIPTKQINELIGVSNWADLYALTLPVYVHLRALGYKHPELTR